MIINNLTHNFDSDGVSLNSSSHSTGYSLCGGGASSESNANPRVTSYRGLSVRATTLPDTSRQPDQTPEADLSHTIGFGCQANSTPVVQSTAHPVSARGSDVLTFSTAGFGVHVGPVGLNDATDAAVRALNDALERSSAQLPPFAKRVGMSVKLGVPPKQERSSEPAVIDMMRLMSSLPPTVSSLPASIVVGGMFVRQGDTTLSTATAVLVQQVRLEDGFTPWATAEHRSEREGTSCGANINMHMLARISAELGHQENYLNEDGDTSNTSAPFLRHACNDETLHSSPRQLMEQTGDISITVDQNKAAHRMSKQPPNNVLVMRDSQGKWLNIGTTRVSVFPVQLHQALTRLEEDGLDHIMSWQPHGRAFKIHNRQEFGSIALTYLGGQSINTFIRQLQIYGFKRTRTGPDKGSFYHELFLRDTVSLSRRIVRITSVNSRGSIQGSRIQRDNTI